ncbi:hypothetical protein [Bradyrhizobium sp. UFLA05-112]
MDRMDRYIAQANIDHYLSLLNSADLSEKNRDTIMKLLIATEDALSYDLEQLEFAERRAATGRSRVSYLTNLRNHFVVGSADRERADRLLANFEILQRQLEELCHRMRERVNSHHA